MFHASTTLPYSLWIPWVTLLCQVTFLAGKKPGVCVLEQGILTQVNQRHHRFTSSSDHLPSTKLFKLPSGSRIPGEPSPSPKPMVRRQIWRQQLGARVLCVSCLLTSVFRLLGLRLRERHNGDSPEPQGHREWGDCSRQGCPRLCSPPSAVPAPLGPPTVFRGRGFLLS